MATPLSEERIAELTYRLKGPVTNPLDWWCEADDLFTIGRELLAEVARLRARVAALEGVLRSVEWGTGTYVYDDDGGRMIPTCPRCLSTRNDGHYSDCALDAALRGADE